MGMTEQSVQRRQLSADEDDMTKAHDMTMRGPAVTVEVKARLLQVMKERRVSGRQMGIRAGLCGSYLNTFLRRADADIGHRTLARIADAFDVSRAWLMAGVGPMDVDGARSERDADEAKPTEAAGGAT